VARLRTVALPRIEVVEFAQLGHMGPVSDPDPVNAAIGDFLERNRTRPAKNTMMQPLGEIPEP
jgi:hypothetical protein